MNHVMSYREVLDNCKMNRFHWYVVLLAGLGGFADFYNISGVIAGGSLSIESGFGVGTSSYALMVALTNVVMLVGALGYGLLGDKFGRRWLFTVDLLSMLVFSVISYFASTFTEFVVLRLLVALAIGGDYPAVLPLVTEFSPKKDRGKLLLIFWVITNMGELVGYFVAWYFVLNIGANLAMERIMILTGFIPIILGIVLRTKAPDSPRWLYRKRKFKDLQEAVRKASGVTISIEDLQIERDSVKEKKEDILPEGFSKRHAIYMALLIVVPLFLVAEGVGIGVYYYPTLFRSLHVSKVNSILYEAILFSPFIPITILAAYVTDKIGRANTVLAGIIPSIIGFVLIIFFHTVDDLLVIILLLISWMGLSEEPLISLASEIFPTFLRSFATGIQTSAWRMGFLATSFILPPLLLLAGISGMYLVESILFTAAGCIVMFLLKPTGRIARKSLEEITRELGK